MRDQMILVVEDDDDIRTQVVAALELEDYRVREARNGREALEVLTELEPDDYPACIILDLMMPEMDGRGFITEIDRAHAGTLGRIPIVIATAKGSYVNPETLPIKFERVQKPFNLDELYETVGRHCGRDFK